jgi:hypothetical protein
MTITTLLIYNRQGKLLLSRLYDDSYASPQASAVLELKVVEHTRTHFNTSRSGAEKYCFTLTDIRFVCEAVGTLQLVLGGREDTDELALSDVLDTLKVVVADQLEGKINEQGLMDPDNYGKVSVVIDEVLCDGIVESLDPETIQKMAKLKSLS